MMYNIVGIETRKLSQKSFMFVGRVVMFEGDALMRYLPARPHMPSFCSIL
jgi:hypothetical protein